MTQETPVKKGASTLVGGAVPKQVLPQPLGAGRKQEAGPGTQVLAPDAGQTLNRLLDVPLALVFEVGRTQITIGQMMELNRGSFIDLWQVSVDVIDIRIDDQVVAHGEAIAVNQHYGIRFGEPVLPLGLENRNHGV